MKSERWRFCWNKCRIELTGELDFKFSRVIFLKIKMTQKRAEGSGVKARNQNFYDVFAPHVVVGRVSGTGRCKQQFEW